MTDIIVPTRGTRRGYEDFKRQVLAEVNDLRRLVGLRPLARLAPGARADPDACPLVHSLEFVSEVNCTYARLRDRRHARLLSAARPELINADGTLRLPPALTCFTVYFDAGYYLDLVAEE